MEPGRRHSSPDVSLTVELLDHDDPLATTTVDPRPRHRAAIICFGAVVAALYAGLVWSPSRMPIRQGALQPVETRFGNAFATEWLMLSGDSGPSTMRGPRPMVSVETFCMGFARHDWDDSQSSPSVALCPDDESMAGIEENGIAVVWEAIAGDNTWFMLVFGEHVGGLGVEIDGTDTLGSDRVFFGNRFAAVLVPNGDHRLHLQWDLEHGGRYQCTVEAHSMSTRTCE